jgi:exodeoxyribonuclease-5
MYRNMPFVPRQFGQEQRLDNIRNRTLWDFGYAMTVHKSQGSEWERVAVFEQIAPAWSAARWRYTAATRASRELVYIRG